MIDPITQELKEARRKAAKPMLWVAMISMTMMFAGLTSAYWVSSGRVDWTSFALPKPFYVSTSLIVASSICLVVSKIALVKNTNAIASLMLLLTLALGLGFVFYQFEGYNALMELGFNFTGPTSNVSTSLLFVITFLHILHVTVGIIVLTVVLVNQIRNKYSQTNLLGFELGAIFWHFVDILWIYLFLFFYFIR